MDIKNYAKTSPLPLRTLYWMVSRKFISNPLTKTDLIGLRLLENLWGKRELLRTQLAQFSNKRRKRLTRTAELETKWERYAFSRFHNNPPGSKLPMKQVVSEIEITFGFLLQPHHVRKLYRIRRKVYNQRYRRKDQKALAGDEEGS